MAFIVEDGTGLSNANSFVDVAYADNYFLERGILSWTESEATEQQKESWLIQASDYVALKNFKGTAKTENQRLPFPRIISGYSEIPEILKNAVCEYAVRAQSGVLNPDPQYDKSGMRITKKSQSLITGMNKSVEYDQNDPFILERKFPYPDKLIEPLLSVASGVTFLRR